jgi:hypothetical protein
VGRRRSWRQPVGMSPAAKIGAACGKSRPRRRQARLLPLPPRRRTAVVFLLADKLRRLSSPTPALRPVATKVRTSFPQPFEPRGNATLAPSRRAAAAGDAGHRARLG